MRQATAVLSHPWANGLNDGARIAADLRHAVEAATALFARVAEDRTARAPGAEKWSARQVIGHLIDSACNNLRRFVINQDDSVNELIIDGYDQNSWVERNRYADTPALLTSA
jgi:hypothetical protein